MLNDIVQQQSQTRGPRAACGPREGPMRPANIRKNGDFKRNIGPSALLKNLIWNKSVLVHHGKTSKKFSSFGFFLFQSWTMEEKVLEDLPNEKDLDFYRVIILSFFTYIFLSQRLNFNYFFLCAILPFSNVN